LWDIEPLLSMELLARMPRPDYARAVHTKNMVMAYIALGSNLGDRAATLRAAVEQLRALPQTTVTAVSDFMETAPIDAPSGSRNFLNAAAALNTGLWPENLMTALLSIEVLLGRDRATAQPKNAPRPIDLDLLLYGDLTLHAPTLTIPHPRMHQRAFVLAPLAQIAPDLLHPPTGKTIRQLLQLLKDPL